MQPEAATFIIQDWPINFKHFEQWADDMTLRLMQEAIKRLDEKIFEEKPSNWVSLGLRERTIETSKGTLTYQRRIYRERKSGALYIPVDVYLGWEPGARVTPEVRRLCAELATKVSYRDVAEILRKIRGIKLSAQTVHEKTQELGEKKVEEEKQKIEEMYSKPGQYAGKERRTIFLEVDGMFACQQRAPKRHFEMRLAVIHEGWQATSPGGDRYQLKNKMVIVEATDAKTFWNEVSANLAQRYDLANCQIIINGDGADWIKEGLEYFPQAVFQLDRFHWLRALRRAVGNSVQALRKVKRLLEEEDWERLEVYLAEWGKLHPEREKLLKEFWGYVVNHKGNIKDWRQRIEVELELARGLGAAESNIDSVLVSRFKRHHRSWSVKGANRLGHLVALAHNGELAAWLNNEQRMRVPVAKEKPVRSQRSVGQGTADWLEKHVPILETTKTPLVITLRGLLDTAPIWAA